MMEATLYKSNWYDNNKINEISEMFSELYGETKGFIKIMSGNNRKGYFYSSEVLNDTTKLAAILDSRRFSLDNVYVSLASYKTMQHATLDNILAVNAIAVDADFTLYPGQEEIIPENAMQALRLAVLEGFPEPTYVEYSRNMRLVYVLDHPYIIPSDKKKAEGCKSFLKRISKCLCDKLNEHTELINFNAEPQRLTSFMRIPFSVNKRTYGHYDYNRGIYVIDFINRYIVNAKQFRNKWDIQKLSEMVLPPLFDGYEEWKQRNKRKEESKVVSIRPQGILVRRLNELEELQRRGYDKGYREKMCYFYWLTARQAGQTEPEAVESVKRFNANFKIPLEEHRLLTDCKLSKYIDGRTGRRCEGWERHFKDSTIREHLGLGAAEPDLFGGKGMSNSDKCKRYYTKKQIEKEAARNTKKQQIEDKLILVDILRKEGKTWQEVADALGVSLRTAKNYGERLKKQVQ